MNWFVRISGCVSASVRFGALEAQVVRLAQLLEQATRKGKRQAAPFSKGLPKPEPKRPGRKPGADYGKPTFRSVPPLGKINEVHEAVLPRRCPACGGAVHQTHTACQYQVEIPPKPIYRKIKIPAASGGVFQKSVSWRSSCSLQYSAPCFLT